MSGSDLYVDIGNQRVKWTSAQQPEQVKATATAFIEQLDVEWQQLARPSNVLVSCVANTAVLDEVQRITHNLWRMSLTIIVVKNHLLGFAIDYDIHALGVDRWLAMLGATKAFADDVLVIDAGTAVTVDRVVRDKTGERFVGGVIFPGFITALNALGQNTGNIPDLALQYQHKSAAQMSILNCNTLDCVVNGVGLSLLHSVKALIDEHKQQAEENLTVVFTGGDGPWLAQHLSGVFETSVNITVESNLVFKGIALWRQACA